MYDYPWRVLPGVHHLRGAACSRGIRYLGGRYSRLHDRRPERRRYSLRSHSSAGFFHAAGDSRIHFCGRPHVPGRHFQRTGPLYSGGHRPDSGFAGRGGHCDLRYLRRYIRLRRGYSFCYRRYSDARDGKGRLQPQIHLRATLCGRHTWNPDPTQHSRRPVCDHRWTENDGCLDVYAGSGRLPDGFLLYCKLSVLRP
ncbi:hypothetical protein SDC9_82948 [bioreactor metagenome]|uniref:Uncharacterized protein n=1 Tax=bioreactor metagenome TaxID=1076179 RepID=A0A644ZCB4_9ZZZZ